MSGFPTWLKALLAIGVVSFLIGAAGLLTTMPDINENLRPDEAYHKEIEPHTKVTVQLEGLNLYPLYQNVTETGSLDGTVVITSNGEELEMNRPSVLAGVGPLEFQDGSKFTPLGYFQPSEPIEVTIDSDSNRSIYLLDQNEVNEAAFFGTNILLYCGLTILGSCLLPLGLILVFRRRKSSNQVGGVTIQSPDGRQVELSMSTPPDKGGAVLTTDQVYALARLQEKAGPDGTVNVSVRIPVANDKQRVPPPFKDRPDEQGHPSKEPTKITSKEPELVITKKNTQKNDEKPTSKDWREWDDS